jgi:predicted nucleotidyltransferase
MDRLDSQTLAKCVDRFNEEPCVLAVWGLGSAFNGRLRSDSDVDFALLYRRGDSISSEQTGHLLMDLGAILGRTVDLGQVSTRNLVYSYQAISQGELLVNRDPLFVYQFIGYLMSLYIDFKFDRKVVEEAYCA